MMIARDSTGTGSQHLHMAARDDDSTLRGTPSPPSPSVPGSSPSAKEHAANATAPPSPSSPPTARYPEGLRLLTILGCLTVGTLLVALDTSVISVATPKISTQFKALKDVGWYGSAYLITLTAFQPISGSVYKLFDPKWAYLCFVLIFEVGSIICAAAPTSVAFIIGRAIAGIGGAGLIQGALGIITFISPLEKRAGHMAIVISVFGIFGSVGPVIGGSLTDKVSWRWCFWINVPIGGICAVLVVLSMRLNNIDKSLRDLPLKEKLRKWDALGTILLIGGVTCLFLALQDGGTTRSWGSARIIGLLVGFGVIILLGFIPVQWKLGENATVPLRFLRQRTVLWGSIFLFFDNMCNYTLLYYMPYYFQAALGASAIKSGVDYISLAAPQFFGMLFSGGVINKVGYYMPVILAGQIICTIGVGLLTTIRHQIRTALWGTYMALAGLGLGMGINAPHIAIQAVMENEDDVFVANGVATFFSQLGGSLSISIGNSILTNGLRDQVPKHTDQVTANELIQAGPLGLASLTDSDTVLKALRDAYSYSVYFVVLFALAATAVAIPSLCGMEWLSLKKIAKEREEAETEKGGTRTEEA